MYTDEGSRSVVFDMTSGADDTRIESHLGIRYIYQVTLLDLNFAILISWLDWNLASTITNFPANIFGCHNTR